MPEGLSVFDDTMKNTDLSSYEATFSGNLQKVPAMCYPYVLLGSQHCKLQQTRNEAGEATEDKELRFFFSCEDTLNSFLSFYESIRVNGRQLKLGYKGAKRSNSHVEINKIPCYYNPTGLMFSEAKELLFPESDLSIHYNGIFFPGNVCKVASNTPRMEQQTRKEDLCGKTSRQAPGTRANENEKSETRERKTEEISVTISQAEGMKLTESQVDGSLPVVGHVQPPFGVSQGPPVAISQGPPPPMTNSGPPQPVMSLAHNMNQGLIFNQGPPPGMNQGPPGPMTNQVPTSVMNQGPPQPMMNHIQPPFMNQGPPPMMNRGPPPMMNRGPPPPMMNPGPPFGGPNMMNRGPPPPGFPPWGNQGPRPPIMGPGPPPIRNQGPPPMGNQGRPPITNQGPPPMGNQGPPPIRNQGPPPMGNQGPPPFGNQGPPPMGNHGPPAMNMPFGELTPVSQPPFSSTKDYEQEAWEASVKSFTDSLLGGKPTDTASPCDVSKGIVAMSSWSRDGFQNTRPNQGLSPIHMTKRSVSPVGKTKRSVSPIRKTKRSVSPIRKVRRSVSPMRKTKRSRSPSPRSKISASPISSVSSYESLSGSWSPHRSRGSRSPPNRRNRPRSHRSSERDRFSRSNRMSASYKKRSTSPGRRNRSRSRSRSWSPFRHPIHYARRELPEQSRHSPRRSLNWKESFHSKRSKSPRKSRSPLRKKLPRSPETETKSQPSKFQGQLNRLLEMERTVITIDNTQNTNKEMVTKEEEDNQTEEPYPSEKKDSTAEKNRLTKVKKRPARSISNERNDSGDSTGDVSSSSTMRIVSVAAGTGKPKKKRKFTEYKSSNEPTSTEGGKDEPQTNSDSVSTSGTKQADAVERAVVEEKADDTVADVNLLAAFENVLNTQPKKDLLSKEKAVKVKWSKTIINSSKLEEKETTQVPIITKLDVPEKKEIPKEHKSKWKPLEESKLGESEQTNEKGVSKQAEQGASLADKTFEQSGHKQQKKIDKGDKGKECHSKSQERNSKDRYISFTGSKNPELPDFDSSLQKVSSSVDAATANVVKPVKMPMSSDRSTPPVMESKDKKLRHSHSQSPGTQSPRDYLDDLKRPRGPNLSRKSATMGRSISPTSSLYDDRFRNRSRSPDATSKPARTVEASSADITTRKEVSRSSKHLKQVIAGRRKSLSPDPVEKIAQHHLTKKDIPVQASGADTTSRKEVSRSSKHLKQVVAGRRKSLSPDPVEKIAQHHLSKRDTPVETSGADTTSRKEVSRSSKHLKQVIADRRRSLSPDPVEKIAQHPLSMNNASVEALSVDVTSRKEVPRSTQQKQAISGRRQSLSPDPIENLARHLSRKDISLVTSSVDVTTRKEVSRSSTHLKQVVSGQRQSHSPDPVEKLAQSHLSRKGISAHSPPKFQGRKFLRPDDELNSSNSRMTREDAPVRPEADRYTRERDRDRREDKERSNSSTRSSEYSSSFRQGKFEEIRPDRPASKRSYSPVSYHAGDSKCKYRTLLRIQKLSFQFKNIDL
ncbi:hypothetical protein ElyMa_002493500 [Elysia marginata]|uniref:Uncharacterized protein n=1 Tax=Elysia marginata TaxID=1093978 RepID=A0AAV4GSG7_9GAST|nr:hypothetical protein ElyMa_002493500 [Elysia marginata]